MKRTRPNRRRTARVRGSFFLESLEPRLVMDGAAGVDPDVNEDGSTTGDQVEIAPESPQLQRFASADELQEYLIGKAVDQWKDQFGKRAPYYPNYPPIVFDAVLGARAVLSESANYSVTNVQVDGVDEGDLVKSDGEYLYVGRDKRVMIVDARDPAHLQTVGTVTVENPIRELYIDGDRLTVISNSFAYGWVDDLTRPIVRVVDTFDYVWPRQTDPSVEVDVYDVTDPAAPESLANFEIDGNLVQSRAIGDTLVLVTQDSIALPPPKANCDSEGENGADEIQILPEHGNCLYETQEEYVARVSEGLLDSVLPHYSIGDHSAFLNEPQDITATGILPVNLVSTTVIDVDAEVPAIADSAGVLTTYATLVYANEESVYVTSADWTTNAEETTRLIKFSLGEDQQDVEVAAIGSVSGRLVNQFALDEHEGFLRVATTQGWGGGATNSLFVLQQDEDVLNVVGSVSDITPGETIVAARFLGDRGFLVTFERIDPLIAVDLSDPENPVISGELEIPGFSNYLHPFGDYLIGLGRDANPESGVATDPQISLFDVSDWADPTLVDREKILGGANGWSPAFFDHHAVSFFEDVGIFAVPFNFSYPQIFLADGTVPDRVSGVLREFDLATLKQFVAELSSDFTASNAINLIRQSIPESLRDVLPADLPSLDEIKEFIAGLPDNAGFREALHRIQDFISDKAGEFEDDLPTIDELKDLIDDLPTEVTDLIARLRDQFPRVLRSAMQPNVRVRASTPLYGWGSGLSLFKIDPEAEDPIQLLHEISQNEPIERSLRIGNTLITVSHNTITAYDVANPEIKLSDVYIGRRVFDDYLTVEKLIGTRARLDVLANDRLPETAKIVSVSDPVRGGLLIIEADGKFLTYSPPRSDEIHRDGSIRPNDYLYDQFTYRVDLGNGMTEEATVHVTLTYEREGRRMAELAKNNLARRLEISPDHIRVVDVQYKEWMDGCLGVEVPDRACTMAITPGFLVLLQVDNDQYEYHTDTGQTVIFAHKIEHQPEVAPDYFRVEQGSQNNEFNVLANDFPGIEFIRAPQISSVSTADHGTVTIKEGGYAVLYTPDPDFHGEDYFFYTVDNGPTGRVTVQVLEPLENGDRPLVNFRLEVVDSEGNPASRVELGDEFTLNVYVQDGRNEADAEGVFSAYLDLEFDTHLAEVSGDISYSPDYDNGKSGVADRSGVDEIGAFASSQTPLGPRERFLVSVPLEATDLGTLSIASNPADLIPQHDMGLYGRDESVNVRRIKFGSATLEIVNGFHNDRMPSDTSGDGVVTHMDAMPLINLINERGAITVKGLYESERQALAAGESGYRRESRRFDVNGDGHCTHMDVLAIFNRVNRDAEQRANPNGEGESAQAVIASEGFPIDPGTGSNSLIAPPFARATAGTTRSAPAPTVSPIMSPSTTNQVNQSNRTSAEIEELLDDLADSAQEVSTVDALFAALGE